MAKLMLSDIKGYDKNNKDHPRQQIDLLKKMITEYGYDSPIIVNKDGIVIAGHGRLLALKELAEEGNKDYLEVEVIKKDKLTKKQEQKYRLLDNKISELATSNPDNIKLELEELEDLELNELYPEIDLKEIELDEANEDIVPEPQKEAKLVKVGDIFQLGNHRIMCGDSTVKEDVDKLMDGKKADMVFTDPPYGMFLDTDYSSMKNEFKSIGKSNKFNKVIGDSEDFNPNLVLFPLEYFDYCDEFFTRGADYYAEILGNRNAGSWIVWDKSFSDSENTDKMYGSNFELCWSKARHKRELARIKWKGLFGMEKDDTKSRVHPTQKPAILAEWFINKYEKKGDGNIVDMYLGSGSTLIACEKTNRICYGMELDPVYIEVILKRYHDYTKGAREIKCLNRTLDLNPILNG